MTTPVDPPNYAFDAANFAESVAREYVRGGGFAQDLFVAFAGLVAAQDRALGASSLIALEDAVLRGGESAASPSA
jgi:hypothetical protein